MTTENPYVKQFPDMMKGKTVLYVHGFASSGQSGTVSRLREVMPAATVIAPDLPIHPAEAMQLLGDLCKQEQPSLIIGTSMGGMYAEQLYGYDRICVNPALEMAETMRAHGMTGTQQFQNPRQDGVQEFYVDKALIKEYKEVTEQRFSLPPAPSGRGGEAAPKASPTGGGLEGAVVPETQRVWGLFGDEDTTVDTYDLFHAVYPQALHFHGEHRMNDRSFMHSVVPVIRWIDDRQEKRERPIIYIGIETLMDAYQKPASSVQKAVRLLIEHYQVYFVAPALSSDPSAYGDATAWLTQHIGVPAWGHTIYTNRRDLLYGDYLLAAPSAESLEGALATVLEYGSDTFKTWEDVIEYFSHLGGQ